MNLPAIRDNVPAPRTIQTVDNVLAEMMRAGSGDLLAEVVLQLKTFTEIVWAASYGADIDVSVTLESFDVDVLHPKQFRSLPTKPELRIQPQIRDFGAVKSLHRMLTDACLNSATPVVMGFTVGYESFHADGTGPARFDITIPGSTDYGDRWRDLMLLMFNSTAEMKAKVDYLAASRVECKTDLETAMYQTCVALSSFYEYALHTRSDNWFRDPFKPKETQLGYEPRLGHF